MDAGRKRQLTMLSKPKRLPEAEPVPEKVYPPWARTSKWDSKYHIPNRCPRCGGWIHKDGIPFEVWCPLCGSIILPWVPVPRGWRTPALSTHSIVILSV